MFYFLLFYDDLYFKFLWKLTFEISTSFFFKKPCYYFKKKSINGETNLDSKFDIKK